MQNNDIYRHKQMQDVEIKLISERGNGWKFESPTHGIKGLWSSRYIESDFDLVSSVANEKS